MQISEKFLKKVDHLKSNLIQMMCMSEVTRNYGETASDKVELLLHLGIAILAVTFLVIAMGWRGGLVVFFCAIDLCFDFIQLLYAGLYIEPDHPFCPWFCGGSCRR
jgi:hypothetical protein